MLYSSILALHIAAGSVGLLSGGTAMVFRKGSRGHVLSGRVFVVAMLTMGMAAVPLGLIKHQYANVGGGIMTAYLVGTAWLTMWRKPGEPGGVIDRLALLVPLSIGLLTWVGGLQVLRSGHISKDGVPVFMNFFIGSICLLAAAGDIRMRIRGGVFGVTRLSRHLWRMCFGLFIASGSFFLGPSNRPLRLLSSLGIGQHLPAALFSVGLYMFLSLLPLLLLIFWLVRVRFLSTSKRKSLPPGADAYSVPS